MNKQQQKFRPDCNHVSCNTKKGLKLEFLTYLYSNSFLLALDAFSIYDPLQQRIVDNTICILWHFQESFFGGNSNFKNLLEAARRKCILVEFQFRVRKTFFEAKVKWDQVIELRPYFPIQFSGSSKISRVPDAFYIDHVKSIGRWNREKTAFTKVHTTATCLRATVIQRSRIYCSQKNGAFTTTKEGTFS